MSRSLWFAAGAGAGVYAMTRVRRTLDSLSADGLRDRWQGLGHAARIVSEEMHTARSDREEELRRRFGLVPTGRPELEAPPPGSTTAPRQLRKTDTTKDTA